MCLQVRVPTHEDGTCLFWEFATDNYDLGFGVYFEWTIAPSNQVSVHVSESSDEEDLEEEEGGGGGGKMILFDGTIIQCNGGELGMKPVEGAFDLAKHSEVSSIVPQGGFY